MIYRTYTKRRGQDALSGEISEVLNIECKAQRYFRYDVDGLSEEQFSACIPTVFSTPPQDESLTNLPPCAGHVFAVEFLPGQYDMRADSAEQCAQLLLGVRPKVKCATVYQIEGCSDEQVEKIKQYLINPVDSRECSLKTADTLQINPPPPESVQLIKGFTRMNAVALKLFYKECDFAMSFDDLIFVQSHFKSERRDPTMTELKVIDTYWSDHCRHTTFMTALSTKIKSPNEHIKASYKTYTDCFNLVHEGRPDKYPSLMDMATIGAKVLKREGRCDAVDVSPEINACTIKTNIVNDGIGEDWLVLFKNETHNHPTEIEPFGGAATCLGGAIRDPLSGRSYVYQSMRITGAGDINADVSDTVKGKLPQRVISKTAANGFSAYGNQIGLCTGKVREYYHSGYVAKRLETGFVVGAAPALNVKRVVPEKGDVVLLIGGETGRDGCGGATGSSKAHNLHSIETCGAEVQKGNPAIERKLQRLFRNGDAARIIKRCNDFGAGGVAVAIGELSSGLDINLDAVPKKYSGLSATELAISESQERMAVVVSSDDVAAMKRLCDEENLDATVVATVTDTARMRMYYGGNLVVDLTRKFLDSNGVRQEATAVIKDKIIDLSLSLRRKELLNSKKLDTLCQEILADPNVCSQRGLGEMFDSTIGAASVLLPFGGKNQITPTQAISAHLPAHTDACTVAACGFDPNLSEQSPYMGALYAVLTSVEKAVATGVKPQDVFLTMQEFFPRCTDSEKWGRPAAALLGALTAQLNLKAPAIGGKDSMSGSFEKLDVPNTLLSFAVGVTQAKNVVTNVLTAPGQLVYRYALRRDASGMPDFDALNKFLALLSGEIARGNVSATMVTEQGGAFAAVAKSCFGNDLGFAFAIEDESLFNDSFGDILLVAPPENFEGHGLELIGITTDKREFVMGATIKQMSEDKYMVIDGTAIDYDGAFAAFCGTFEKVYPTAAAPSPIEARAVSYNKKSSAKVNPKFAVAKPRVFIPVFPGTNCEYDSAKRFTLAGGLPFTKVVRNRSSSQVEESAQEIANAIKQSQIIMFPGGFSGGDEPDGSAKMIASFFAHPAIKEAMDELLQVRGGLVLGICNGFQALVRLGLLPYGAFRTLEPTAPILTYNGIGRHMSRIVNVRVASQLSPWFNAVNVGEVYSVAVSHGEGRFVATADELTVLEKNGQIAAQYCDEIGAVRTDMPFNPNGSFMAIEAVTSPDGRVLGKMGHSERIGTNLYKNYQGADFDMGIFESGVKFFK